MTALRGAHDTSPGPFSFEALTWFVRAAEAGSLSRAAARAKVAQSTVSRAIGRLEAQTGVALFHRSARAFSLTDAGAALLPLAHEALAGLEGFGQAAASVRGASDGVVRLSLCTTLGRHVLMPGLLAWARAHETLTLDLRFEERELDPRVAGLDVVVRAGRPADREVMCTPLGDYGHVLVASPGWVRRHGTIASPAALAALPTVAIRLERVWSTWLYSVDGEALRVQVAPRLCVSDADALVEAACAGAGATVLPDYLAAGPLRTRALLRLCPSARLPRIPVFAFHAPRRRMPLRARQALETMAATMRALASTRGAGPRMTARAGER